MTTTKPVKTVPATCACGSTFAREVKRGRPQVWCPSCALVPFYERVTERAVVETAANLAEVLETLKPDRIPNPNDPYDHVRHEIEGRIAESNIASKTRFAELVAAGSDVRDASRVSGEEHLAVMRAIYGDYTKVTTP